MRFSDIVKPRDEAEAAFIQKETPPKTAKPPQPIPSPPRKAPAQAEPLRVDRAAIEKELRAQLEKEFQMKREGMETELKMLFEKKRQEEVVRLREHEDTLLSQQEKLSRMFEEFQKQKEEKQKEEKRKEVTESERRMEELQKKILERDQTLRKMEAEIRGQKEKTEERTPTAPAARPKAPEQYETSVETGPPPIVEIPPFTKPVVREKVDVSTIFDPVRHKKAKSIAEELIARGSPVIEKIAKSEPFEVTGLTASLASLVDLALQSDAELIHLLFQPYSETTEFISHALNSAILSVILGLDLQLASDELRELALAAFLHDVGLVNIRENLNYPKQLTDDVQKEILSHPIRGADLLADKVSEPAVTAIRQHHEVCNGKGYPEGLTDKQIHLYAKILHVADVFEALTHERPYRKKPFEVNEAMKEIIEKGRGVYDPAVMKVLMGRIGLYPPMSLVELSNKQIARVIRLNRKFPLSPVLRVEFDENGNKLERPPVLDLSESRVIHITGPVRESPSFHAKKMAAETSRTASAAAGSPRFIEFIPMVLIAIAILLLLYIVVKI